MSSDAIYLVNDSGELQRVEHQFYESEDVLQQLVAKHPELIAGDQIDPDYPPRWLLVQREATIPDSIDGPDRWWLDHLLLDQFGVPTLVEVKRSSDTRIRREVVGQMLDYIANAQANWAVGRMRQMMVDETGSPESADAKLVEFASLGSDPTAIQEQIQLFWQKVEANLREGNVRLLFVADELPKELRRLIEFLNEQFKNVEVLGVELRQYVGQGIKALVPRVVGQTEAAREQKDISSPARKASSRHTPATFLSTMPVGIAEFFASVLEKSLCGGFSVNWTGKGFNVRAPGEKAFLYCYDPSMHKEGPAVDVYLADIRDSSLRDELRRRVTASSNVVPGGDHTLHVFVTEGTLSSAGQVVDASFDLMQPNTK